MKNLIIELERANRKRKQKDDRLLGILDSIEHELGVIIAESKSQQEQNSFENPSTDLINQKILRKNKSLKISKPSVEESELEIAQSIRLTASQSSSEKDLFWHVVNQRLYSIVSKKHISAILQIHKDYYPFLSKLGKKLDQALGNHFMDLPTKSPNTNLMLKFSQKDEKNGQKLDPSEKPSNKKIVNGPFLPTCGYDLGFSLDKELFSEVLIEYLEEREQISFQEETCISQPTKKVKTERSLRKEGPKELSLEEASLKIEEFPLLTQVKTLIGKKMFSLGFEKLNSFIQSHVELSIPILPVISELNIVLYKINYLNILRQNNISEAVKFLKGNYKQVWGNENLNDLGELLHFSTYKDTLRTDDLDEVSFKPQSGCPRRLKKQSIPHLISEATVLIEKAIRKSKELPENSKLREIIKAGLISYPEYFNDASIFRATDKSNSSEEPLFPKEIDCEVKLDEWSIHHSMVFCPITKELCDHVSNRVMIQSCGHIVGEQSVKKMLESNQRAISPKFKCPTCPNKEKFSDMTSALY